jgi:hypothetical protein
MVLILRRDLLEYLSRQKPSQMSYLPFSAQIQATPQAAEQAPLAKGHIAVESHMGGNVFRWPVLFSLLLTLLGSCFMVIGIAGGKAELSRGGLAFVVSFAPLPLLWRTPFALAPGREQNRTQAAPNSPRFYALLALALATHGVGSFWLWWWAGEPFCGTFFAVMGGLFALQLFLEAVSGWLSMRIKGQKGSVDKSKPNNAEPAAAADRPRE